jgi:hypothetical protein
MGFRFRSRLALLSALVSLRFDILAIPQSQSHCDNLMIAAVLKQSKITNLFRSFVIRISDLILVSGFVILVYAPWHRRGTFPPRGLAATVRL